MTRKITEVFAVPTPEGPHVLVALCDDGTVWTCALLPHPASQAWQEIVMPQTEPMTIEVRPTSADTSADIKALADKHPPYGPRGVGGML